jgi:hypothetical protein
MNRLPIDPGVSMLAVRDLLIVLGAALLALGLGSVTLRRRTG